MDKLEEIAARIHAVDFILQEKFKNSLSVNSDLGRRLVSYQADKNEPVSRWCKYREGYSTALIHYILEQLPLAEGRVLDPFAGSGTTLFAASEYGLDAVGIELLPNAISIMKARQSLNSLDRASVSQEIHRFSETLKWENPGPSKPFSHLTITKGAFPPETERLLARFRHESEQVANPDVRLLLSFATMSVLEDISYTRKDGQYLRWDARARRRNTLGNGFQKARIKGFTEAIIEKCQQICDDIADEHYLTPYDSSIDKHGEVTILSGSALEILPQMESASFDGLITSPPYCNRYDYTRTYALELALLGIDDNELKQMRQAMLSCTVENKEKVDLADASSVLHRKAMQAFESQELLQSLLAYLDESRERKLLNNNGIPRMVRNYFSELTWTIFECSRLLKDGASFVMVNDNVRYQGMHIPVDLILSDIACSAGFTIEHIWILPKGKGSSSQQHVNHGREEIRKCVYVWRKSTPQ